LQFHRLQPGAESGPERIRADRSGVARWHRPGALDSPREIRDTEMLLVVDPDVGQQNPIVASELQLAVRGGTRPVTWAQPKDSALPGPAIDSSGLRGPTALTAACGVHDQPHPVIFRPRIKLKTMTTSASTNSTCTRPPIV
jgi:hypothetical protein